MTNQTKSNSLERKTRPTQLNDIMNNPDLKNQIENFIEKEVENRVNEKFQRRVDAEVKKQMDIFKQNYKVKMDQEVQKLVSIELRKQKLADKYDKDGVKDNSGGGGGGAKTTDFIKENKRAVSKKNLFRNSLEYGH